MQGEATIFDEPHHHALELLAAKALAKKEYTRAFELSDRRCRITPAPQPHAYLLRAEASFRMGQKRYAVADLETALGLSPNDNQANRRMLAWSTGKLQRQAARSLLTTEPDLATLRKAIEVLQQDGHTSFASLTVLDDKIRGWVAWKNSTNVEISIVTQNNVISSFIEPDPFHNLSSDQLRAASFSLSRPKSSEPQSFAISIEGRPILTRRAPGNERLSKGRSPRTDAVIDAGIPTVIIPVYADFNATKACLKSVSIAMQQTQDFRVVIIDDATPDHRIKDHLAAFAEKTGFELLTNPHNLGFVGSINRALGRIRHGDVVLLNSDTVAPPGFVGRLAATAHGSTDIGTVIPLSNNGEFSSFPIPDQANELGTYDDIVALDGLAAKANDSSPVDIPSGIGFCLYITRACLNEVGGLSEGFQRGYLEDVDFCLRARELGFRSVCAPSVYVGHAGSRSFKSEKRSLVIRNLEVLDGKFPSYRDECSAFVGADALRPAREAIERLIPERNSQSKIMITGCGALREVAQARADALLSRGQPTLILEAAAGSDAVAKLVNPTGASPQNLRFVLSEASERKSLNDFLHRIQPSGFEIIDPANTPLSLLEMITDLRIPYDVLIADSGLFYPTDDSLQGVIQQEIGGTSQSQNHVMLSNELASRRKSWERRWRDIAKDAAHIIAPGSMAKAFASRHLPGMNILVSEDIVTPSRWRGRRDANRLGILALWRSTEELASIRKLAQAIFDAQPDLAIVIIGATIDDRIVMKGGNAFVTGPVAPDEFSRILNQYGIGSILTGLGRPLFGHPYELAAAATGLPMARLDWSFGDCSARPGDLMLRPDSCPADMAASVADWMEGASHHG